MKVGIVVPIINQFQLAVEMIESIRTQHEVAIYPMLNYRGEHRSLSGAWNQGIDRAADQGCDYALVVNDDILFSPWTIDGLVSFFKSEGPDTVMVTGWNVREQLHNIEDIYTWPSPWENLFGENPDFACFMVRPEILDIVGRFDEAFDPAYFEDNDYHYRINLSGHKAVFTTLAPYFHYGSKSQNANPMFPAVPPPVFEMNKMHYMNKWGGEPGKEAFKTPYNNPEKTFKD